MIDELERIEGALLGTIVGDALGLPFEGTPIGDLPRLHRALARRIEAPRCWDYSDDSEMMLALADSVIRVRGIDSRDILETLAARCDVARGYGKGMRTTLRAWRESRDEWSAARATWEAGSRGNGGVVRLAPVIALHRHEHLEVALDAAARSAATTHCHPDALCAARGFGEALWRAFRGDHAPIERSDPIEVVVRKLGHGVLAAESVPLALWTWEHTSSFRDAVLTAVGAGGDTDTIGAMVGALAGATYGSAAIPPDWLDALVGNTVQSTRHTARELRRCRLAG